MHFKIVKASARLDFPPQVKMRWPGGPAKQHNSNSAIACTFLTCTLDSIPGAGRRGWNMGACQERHGNRKISVVCMWSCSCIVEQMLCKAWVNSVYKVLYIGG